MLNSYLYSNFYRIVAFAIIMNSGLCPSMSVYAVQDVRREYKKQLSKVQLSILGGSAILLMRDTWETINLISPGFLPGVSKYRESLFPCARGSSEGNISARCPDFGEHLIVIVGSWMVHGGLAKWAWDNKFVTTT